jgi:hypothetical protein
MGRLDRNILKPEAVPNIKGRPSDYLRHFYYDTCVYDTLAPARARAMHGGGRHGGAIARHRGAG